jgi:hypothetical protein
MNVEDSFDCALNSIEQGELSLDVGDAPERYLHAARVLYHLDPEENERVLLGRAKESDVCGRQRYVYALMYFGAMKGNLRDETFEFLADLCERPAEDAGTREAAASALYWSEFENASMKNLDLIHATLERITSAQPPILTARTIRNARASVKSLEARRELFSDFLAGRIVVPERIIQDLLTDDGPGSLTSVGYGESNVDGLVRLIVWTAMWLWPSRRKRRTRQFDYYEVGTMAGAIDERGVSLSVIWKVDRRTNQKTVFASYVGVPESRPELIPSWWPWGRGR